MNPQDEKILMQHKRERRLFHQNPKKEKKLGVSSFLLGRKRHLQLKIQ